MVPRFHRTERLADDGKRLCDLDRARDVVFRVAPQDNSVGRGRSGGGMVAERTASDGWRMTGSAFASYRGAGRCG